MIRKLVVYTITVVFLLCSPVKANQQNVSTVKESIVKHSIELGIDPALALSIAKSESGFRHEARSKHGAVGVFQLMPSTAKRLGVDPYCLSGNIKGGLMYYKKLYNMFGSTELALAAYNAGPGRVKRTGGVPKSTKGYISRIMKEYHNQKANPDPVISKVKDPKNFKEAKIAKEVKIANKEVKEAKVDKTAKAITAKAPAVKTAPVVKHPIDLAKKPAAPCVKKSAPTPQQVLPLQGVV